jgi:hypothetical protein
MEGNWGGKLFARKNLSFLETDCKLSSRLSTAKEIKSSKEAHTLSMIDFIQVSRIDLVEKLTSEGIKIENINPGRDA